MDAGHGHRRHRAAGARRDRTRRNVRRAARPSGAASAPSCSGARSTSRREGRLAARPAAGEASLTRPHSQRRSRRSTGRGRRSASSITCAPFAAACGARHARRRDRQDPARARRTTTERVAIDELIAPNRGRMSGAASVRAGRRERARARTRGRSRRFPAARNAGARARRAGVARLPRAHSAAGASRPRLRNRARLRRDQDAARARLVSRAVPRRARRNAAAGDSRDLAPGGIRTRLHARRRARDGVRVRQPREALGHRGLANLVNARAALVSARPPARAAARVVRRRRRVSRHALLAADVARASVARRLRRAMPRRSAPAVNEPRASAIMVNTLAASRDETAGASPRWAWRRRPSAFVAESLLVERGAGVEGRRRRRLVDAVRELGDGGRTCSSRSRARRFSTSAADAATRRCKSARASPAAAR